MKKLTTTLTIIAILLLSFTSCDKDPIDYTGNWDFVTKRVHYQTDSISGESILKYDTIYYSGTITYTYEGYNNHLIIQYTESDSNDVIIDKKGNIYTVCPGKNVECGAFEGKNNVHFSLGCRSYEYIDYIVGSKRKEVNNE